MNLVSFVLFIFSTISLYMIYIYERETLEMTKKELGSHIHLTIMFPCFIRLKVNLLFLFVDFSILIFVLFALLLYPICFSPPFVVRSFRPRIILIITHLLLFPLSCSFSVFICMRVS